MIAAFKLHDRVFHAEHGEGTVTLLDKQNVGIRFNRGTLGAYGIAYFDRFPDTIIKRCGVCSRRLDVDGEADSLDCGGDCRGCVKASEAIDTSDIPEADEDWFARARLYKRRPSKDAGLLPEDI